MGPRSYVGIRSLKRVLAVFLVVLLLSFAIASNTVFAVGGGGTPARPGVIKIYYNEVAYGDYPGNNFGNVYGDTLNFTIDVKWFKPDCKSPENVAISMIEKNALTDEPASIYGITFSPQTFMLDRITGLLNQLVDVAVPIGDLALGTYYAEIYAVTAPHPPPGTNMYFYFEICQITRGVEASISPIHQGGLLGETLEYTITIKNEGNVEDNYDLTVADDAGWSLNLENTSLIVPACGCRTTMFSVAIPRNIAIPDNVENHTSDSITVTATSQTDNTVKDNADCIARSILENTITSHLVSGWNLVGFTGVGENDTPNHIFKGLNYFTDYYIYYWNAPGGPYSIQGPDQVLKDNTGYWIWVNQDMTVYTSSTPQGSHNIYLVAGWNLVSFPITFKDATPANLFAGVDYMMYYWEAPYGPYHESLNTQPVKLGVGYWIWTNQDIMVTVP